MLGFVLAIAGAATGGNLVADDYHQNNGGSAHKALGILTIVAAAVQVGAIYLLLQWQARRCTLTGLQATQDPVGKLW